MFFILSTGRAGSRTLANVLSQSPDAICLHEPVPYLVEECVEYRYGAMSADDLAAILAETRPRQLEGKQYGESANRLSLAVPVLASTFPDARFVWLTRDGREVVASGQQRGWHDPTRGADTQWERHRLRGDRLGEVSEAEWEAWSPLRRNSWLWRRTNELIRDDLAALDPDRWVHVRLEDLESSLDGLAAFLGVAPADWTVPRLNARTTKPAAGDPAVNRVEAVHSHADWSTADQAIFAEVCGPIMDDLYAGWREAAEPSAEPCDPPAGDDGLDEIRTKLADLAVLRGELNRVVEREARTSRRLQNQMRDVARLESELSKTIAELKETSGRAEEASKDAADASEAATEAEQQLEATQHRLELTQQSTSYRLGHVIVRAVKAPVVGSKRLAKAPRRFVRRSVNRVVRRAARHPRAASVAKRLPAGLRERLVSVASGSSGKGFGRTRSDQGSGGPDLRQRFGLRAAVDPSLDPAWREFLDDHPIDGIAAAELTHLDLVLTAGNALPTLADAVVTELQSAVVDVRGRLAPLRPGLSPIGFERDHRPEFLTLGSGSPAGRAALPPGRTLVEASSLDLPDAADHPEPFREAVQSFVGLIDAAGDHASPSARARMLVDIAACGLPVCVTDPETLADVLPREIVAEFGAVPPRSLTDRHEREKISARQRRVVHEHASPRAVLDRLLLGADRPGLRLPSISVTVASNRPEMIPVWASQLAVQEYPDFEVVASMHGDGFTDADVELAHELLGDRLTVCRIPEHHTLGDALNAGVAVAGGEVVSKWDDDDLYDRRHLSHLVSAMDYSGATLVGKAAEFVYLAQLDVTVRRLKTSTELYSRTIGGPSLTIRRGDLRELGGWRRTRRRVDSLLIEDVRNAGGATYRTSGFGFIMMRGGGGHGHTWGADDGYFLRGSVDQRRGLDTSFADVDVPASVVERWVS